jgi:hypothetical protein
MMNGFLTYHLKTVFIASLVSGIVAFIGVCLWVFVLTGAIALPAWVIAIWIIVNILLTAYTLAALIAHILALPEEGIVAAFFVSGIVLLFGGMAAWTLGPGMISVLDFIVVLTLIASDLYLFFHSDWMGWKIEKEESNG